MRCLKRGRKPGLHCLYHVAIWSGAELVLVELRLRRREQVWLTVTIAVVLTFRRYHRAYVACGTLLTTPWYRHSSAWRRTQHATLGRRHLKVSCGLGWMLELIVLTHHDAGSWDDRLGVSIREAHRRHAISGGGI